MTMESRTITLETLARMAKVPVAALNRETELVADLGFDSTRALELVVTLEERLDVEVPDDAMLELNTVGDVLDCIGRLSRKPGRS